MIILYDHPSLIQLTELSWLNTFLWFIQKHNFLEYQIFIVLLHDQLRNFFYSCWASFPINLVEFLVLDWPFIKAKFFVFLKYYI